MLENFLYEFLWVGCDTTFEKMCALMLFTCIFEVITNMCGLFGGGRR